MNEEKLNQVKEACSDKALEILKKETASPDELRIALELAAFGVSSDSYLRTQESYKFQ